MRLYYMEAKKARGDIVLYAVLTAAGAVFYKWIIPTQIYISKTASAEAFSPDTFPNAVTTLFVLASLAGLILSIFRYSGAVKREGRPEKSQKVWTARDCIGVAMPFIVFGLIVVYAMLFNAVGFILATAIVPPVILFVIGCRKWHYYAIYYGFVTLMYLLFRLVLMVPIR
ncbi:tripartite tricarboxylate transporter TctB family protein [Bacteroides sp. OttesenSCG-928-J23]|nr:tripartite tricarboxylate transporter TctB family protein [Bacteroides sp. OttesenSCG-928-J23]